MNTVPPLGTKNCGGRNKHNSQSLPSTSYGISTQLSHTESLSKHLAMAILKNQNGLGPFEIKNCRLSMKSKSITNPAKKREVKTLNLSKTGFRDKIINLFFNVA